MRTKMELLEFVPGSVYFLSSHTVPNAATPAALSPLRMAYIHVEKEFPYQNFYLDYGPLHLAHVFAFARALDERLSLAVSDGASSDDNQRDADASALDARVCVYSSMVPQHRVNAACLLGCWAILFKKWTANRAFAPFKHLSLPSFHDASPNVDRFGLGVLDVLRALEKAVHRGLFAANVDDFDDAAFLDDMDPDKRDLTWITPRIAAFAGPNGQQNWFGRTEPHDYVAYFRSHGVSRVVRLNTPQYDKLIFTREGVDVIDLYFPDGTCPSDTIVAQFLALWASPDPPKVAIHCKAGLGRTGTLIACYLMHIHSFSAEEAIAWLRLCRPGSVIGAQQEFLRALQPRLASLVQSPESTKTTVELTPEDVSLAIDEDREQNVKPQTKGIAARLKSSSPTTRLVPAHTKALPPKIPGRRPTDALPPTPMNATQGDLLLLRKQAQQLQVPLSEPHLRSSTIARDLIQ